MAPETKPESKGLAKSPLDTMKDIFAKQRPQLEDLLPQGVTSKEVISAAINACRENPTLLECTPASMLGAVAKCCQLGIPPADGTHRACLVPFRNNKKSGNPLEAQLLVEYRGLVYLAQNVENLTPNNQIVCEKDFFEYMLGSAPYIKHRLAQGDRGAVLGAYSVLQVEGKPPVIEYMTKAEIDSIRSRSRAKDSGPWVTDYPMMARKTVLRRALRLAPMSSKRGEILQQAVVLDEKAELGIPQELELLADPQAVGKVKTNEERIQDAEAGRPAAPAPTMGAPAPAAPAQEPEKAPSVPPGALILSAEELADVQRALGVAKTFNEANKAFLALPEAWQSVPEVINLYQKKAREVKKI